MRKIRTHHNHPQGRIFSWIALFLGLAIGLSLPIFPLYTKSIINSDTGVSLFYAVMAILMFAGAILSTVLFKKYERTTITKAGLLLSAIAFFGLIFVTHYIELSILNTIKMWFTMFVLMALSLFVRDFANKKHLGKDEGIFYTFNNIGYLVGPLLGGFIAIWMSYEMVFLLSAVILFTALAFFYHQHVITEHPAIINRKKTSVKKITHNCKEFFSDEGRVKAYVITLVHMGYVGFIRLYLPLYVLYTGYIESMSGLIMAVGMIPIILLEIKVGEYADKKGVRVPVSLGYLTIATSLLVVFISPFFLFNFLVLVASHVGAGLVEPLQEYYLFKHLPKSKEDNLYGIYMTADPLAFFITPIVGAVILLFLPFKFVFLGFGILFGIAALWARTSLKR